MPRSYVEVAIRADRQLVEHLIGIMSQLGFEGFWEDDVALKCYMSSERWTDTMHGELESIARSMARSSSSPLPKISVNLIEDRNWNEAWEKTIQPIHVTDRIVIRPTWHQYDTRPDEIVLVIDPKMSFGTGYHETTRLVLSLMEKHLQVNSHVLDVGTGTGVLAIAAIKLGASSAVGVDVTVKIIAGDLSSVPPERFGLIVANIQRNVIEPLLGDMYRRLMPGGIIILSGLLISDRDQMRAALHAAGFEIVEEMVENEWIALAAQKAHK
ncbi:MAG: ribosomal protein methyltransferase [Bacteroidetes bacterium]|nr:ribosomal protein methyltransferase [Bacteroidota bacterium]